MSGQSSGLTVTHVLIGALCGFLTWALLSGMQERKCNAACAPNVMLESHSEVCQCAEPGKDGKVYYVKPEATP